MKRHLAAVIVIAILVAPAAGCANSSGSVEQTGTLDLYLADAPIDAASVEAVYIKIDGIQYNNQGEWVTFEDFAGPQEYDLLELTGGTSALLGNLALSAGQYNQIRFMLDVAEQGQNPTNPGCYIEFCNGSTAPLFVPSSGSSGYKATGAFQVPINGSVEITVDFDVRKAVTVTGGSGRYILRPTLRLIVNDEAGKIGGSIANLSGYTDIAVYAYEDSSWQASEADDPAAGEARFPGAVTSDMMGGEADYMLAFLAAGTYDLVVAGFDGDTFGEVLGFIPDVEVESKKKTVVTTSTDSLESAL